MLCCNGFPTFSNQLAANLHRCCRKHFSPVRDEAAAVPDLDGSASTDAGLGAELDSKLRFSEASCLFNSEEADGEAIIDTGASRAVIGENRVQGMIQSLPPHLGKLVYRAQTSGVTFKFGNSAKLTSQYALLLPRSQNGWIRVEVVPGQTPFLISNSILKGLKGIVDVDGKKTQVQRS